MNQHKSEIQSIGDNDTFVHLIRAAQEDPTFAATLCGILRQPSFHRTSFLNTMVAGMKADGVNDEFIQAITALTDDDIAKTALELLNGTNEAAPPTTEAPEGGDRIVCPGCLTEQNEGPHFCVACGAPLTAFAAVGPFERIHAQGYAYRRATSGPTSLIVVIGMWLICFPSIIAATAVITTLPAAGTIGILSMMLVGIFCAAYGTLLYRVTKNYIQSQKSKGDDT